jgi:hypothetical protein
MNVQSGIRVLLMHTAAFGIGALVAASCLKMDLPTVAYRCNPRQADNCPDTHYCCSDDPAAVGGARPEYLGKDIGSSDTPIFSGMNNGLGTSGMCIRRDDIPPGYGLLDPGAENCPVPCNPRWEQDDINAVCGGSDTQPASCCQTAELEPKDCILVGSSWRPVEGTDYQDDGSGPTFWTPGEHATHQDPGLAGCQQFALGNQSTYNDCIDQLTVADQRGFCMFLQTAMGEVCGTDNMNYIDPCDCINQGFCPPPGM